MGRPVDPAEVQKVFDLCRAELDAGTSFRVAVRTGVIAVLCSPKFLYILEPSASDDPRPLDDWEIASRLSYFLWSSMPDEELFELASAGTNYGSQALATISWNEQGVPLAAENDPKVLFDQLFRPDTPQQKGEEAIEFRRRRSILDLVRDDARQIHAKLGSAD